MANSEIIGAGQGTARPAPKINTITCGDCLELMPSIPDKSVNMVLCDLPYGTTDCKWDSLLPLDYLMKHYFRICSGAVVLTARMPFSARLVSSAFGSYRHKWVWNKKQSGSFANAKYAPLQIDEDILVFSVKRCPYFPIMRTGVMRKKGGSSKKNEIQSGLKQNHFTVNDQYYPVNIIEMVNPRIGKLHPTEKPVALFEYLIRTYTNEGDTVLDNCIGSGTTAIACINTGRNFIGIEKEEKYCRIAEERIHALRNPAQDTVEICHTAPNRRNTQNAQVNMDL